MNSLLLLVIATVGQQPSPFRLVDQARHERYLSMLPPVDDPKIAALFQSPDLIFYTDREMEPAYQHRGAVLAVSYDLSGGADRKKRPDGRGRGNGNLEPPWDEPFGTKGVPEIRPPVRFFKLPRKPDGTFWPVVYWFEESAASAQSLRLTANGPVFHTTEGVWVWMFPHGTIFEETIHTKTYTRECRLRSRDVASWMPDVYGPDCFEVDYANAGAVRSNHPFPSFREAIPRLAMPDTFEAEELIRHATFRSQVASDRQTTAVEVSKKSCMRCHNDTLRLAAEFEEPRDWYGRVRGCDGIFSWHPFDPSCISHNGFGKTVRMRKEFVAAGIVERYDPAKHPKQMYSMITGMKPRTPWAKK